MLSKLKLDKSLLNCCKCDVRCANISEPVELPCQHLMCAHCVRSLKFKFHFHCKMLKVFLKKKNVPQSEIDAHSSSSSYFINKLRRIEFADNYLLENLKFDKLDLNPTSFRRAHFSCPICKRLYNTNDSNSSSVTLLCFHTVCKQCLANKSQDQNECPVCLIKFNTNDSEDFCRADSQISQVIAQIDTFIYQKQAQKLERLNQCFTNINAKINQLRGNQVKLKFAAYIRQIESKANQSMHYQVELNLNRQRDELFKLLEASLRTNFSSSSLNEKKDRKLYLKTSQLTVNFLGEVKLNLNRDPVRLIKQLHLNNQLIPRSYNLQAKHITHPQIQITGFNWLRQSPKADFLVPCAENKIFYIYNYDNARTYRFKLANPRDSGDSSKPRKHVEYEFNFKMKLEYCRFDYDADRVALFFERAYDREYCLRVYSCSDLTRAVSVKDFDHFIENLLFDSNEVISWSSLNYPFVRYFTSDLREQVLKNRVAYNPAIFAKFYALADCSRSHLVFHNKDTIGVVDKRSGQTIAEINTKLYEDDEDAMRNELHQQRMRAYQSQSKSEYFNVKCLANADQLLVSTWSKVYVFSMLDGTLLAKNDIHLIPNNMWLLPNRLYLNRDGDIVFFDTSTSFLTFM
jgi:hypothetical protein